MKSSYEPFLLEVFVCPVCGKKMMKKCYGFPMREKATQKIQMGEKGIVYMSDSTVHSSEDMSGINICVECESSGKSSFKCALCNEIKSSDKMKETIGDVWPDYLCSDCYSTVSAKAWDETCEKLEDEHRYDYE